jgi:hypothetical protein
VADSVPIALNATFWARKFDQIGGLLERHVAIVIAMDEQHGGTPVREVHATGGSPSLPGAVRSAECMSGCRGCDVACAEKKHERITARAMQVVADFISMSARFLLNSPSLSRSPNEKALGNKEQL